MSKLIFSSELATSQEKLWQFHSSTAALTRISPPSTKVYLKNPPTHFGVGTIFTLVVSQPPLYVPLRWDCEFMVYEPPYRFVDRQVPGKGPFALWEHEHRFEVISTTRCRLVDTLTYELPFGTLGRLVDRLFMQSLLRKMFRYRHEATKKYLETV